MSANPNETSRVDMSSADVSNLRALLNWLRAIAQEGL
jgi:hypothetical protein